MKTLVIYSLCLAMAAPAVWSADTAPLRGYSSEKARTEREWEAKFRAIPDPADLRAYMQRLSARPHHVGSPYDKDNAEWILAKFKEWGLDAQIETFDVLFPTPKERALELVEPTHVHRQARRAHRRRRSHLRRSTTSSFPPTTPTPSMATSPRRWST